MVLCLNGLMERHWNYKTFNTCGWRLADYCSNKSRLL